MRTYLAALVVVLSLSACGKENANISAGDAVVLADGRCSQQVVDDNNRYVRVCSAMTTREEGYRCKAEAKAFADRYPGLRCQSVKQRDGSPHSITQARALEVVRKLEELGL